MTIAERWAERMPLASRAAAADPMTVWFPLVLERAGRSSAALAWACAFSEPRTRAVALARLARLRKDPRIAKLAFDESLGAPRGTTLEVLALVGLPEPIRDHARGIVNQVAQRDPIGMATRLWCETLYNTGEKLRLQQNARRYEGVEFLLDCAAVHARMPHMPNRPAHDERERTIAAMCVDKPADVLQFIDPHAAQQPELLLRLVELGDIFDAQRLADQHPHMRALVAWATHGRLDFDVPDAGPLALLCRAIKLSPRPHALDDLAHELAVGVIADGRDEAHAYVAGEPVAYDGVALPVVEAGLAHLRRWRAERGEPNVHAIHDLLRAAMRAAHRGDKDQAHALLDAMYDVDFNRLGQTTLSLALAAMTKADRFRETWLDGSGRLLPQFVVRMDGHATREHAAKLDPAAAHVLLLGRIPTFSRRDLIALIPTVRQLEPGCEAMLREGIHAADDSLATLHIV